MTPRLRLAALFVLVAAGAAVALRTEVSTSLSDALPHDGALGRAFADVDRFTLLDTVWIEIDGTGQPPEALHAAIEAMGTRLDGDPELAGVRWRFGMEDAVALQQAAQPSLGLLLPTDTLRARLSDEGLHTVFAAWQQKLMGPAAALFGGQLETDPLDLGTTFTEAAVRSGAQGGAVLEEGHILSADRTHGLVQARPKAPAFGTTIDAPLVHTVEAAIADSALPAAWLGSHRFAAEAQATIRNEVNRAVTAGLAGLVLVFLLAFRNVRPLLGTIPATVVGAVLAGAAAGLASPVHGIALAYGGALASLGVDYWIHLYITGVGAGVPDGFDARLKAGLAALRHMLPAYRISVAATVASFLMLATSSYPVVADIGWIGVGVAVGALASVVLAGPLVFALVARPQDRLPAIGGIAAPGKLAAALVVGLALLAGFAADVRFDGDPRALDARLPETAALEEGFARRYGSPTTTGLIVAEGLSLDAALEQLAPAVDALAAAPAISVQSPLSLLPSPSQRAERAALWADPTLEARFSDAAEAAGFAPEMLVPGLRAAATSIALPKPDRWTPTASGALVTRLIREEGDHVAVAAVVPALTVEALDHAEAEVRHSGADVRFISPVGVAKEGGTVIRDELLSRSGLALLGVLLFMALRYRDIPRFMAAAFPSLAAVTGTLGVLALTDTALTPVSGPAFVLILGLAFDQGIFLVEAGDTRDTAFQSARAGIVVALATAFAGFAGLLVASHPAVWSVGAVVCLGIGFTALGAFVVVPAMLTPDGMLRTRGVVRALALLVTLGFGADALMSVLGRLPPPTVATPTPSENRLVRDHGMWVGRMVGSAATIGADMGRFARTLDNRNEASLLEELQRPVPSRFARYALLRATPLLARSLVGTIPTPYLEEIAAGTMDPDDPLAYIAPRYTRKVCLHALHDVGQAMVDAPWVSGCTGFVAGGSRTEDGHWLLARNWDFDGGHFFDEDKAVIAFHRDGAIPFVHVAIPTLHGSVSGVNEAGIAVAVLAAASDAPIRPDTPMIFILRRVLEEARSLDDVARILDEDRGFVSEGILAVDGEHGEAAIFEVTPDDVTRIPAGEAMALSNHLRGPHAGDDMNQLRMAEGTTVSRQARMEELLVGPLSMRRAVDILRDRKGPGGITLPDGHEGAINADNTSHSFIADATTRSIWVARYPNTSGAYVQYRLADLLAGRLEGVEVAPADAPERALRVHEARSLVRAQPEDRASLERALGLNPKDPDATIALATLLSDTGDHAAALALLDGFVPERAVQARQAEAIRAEAAR